MCEGGRAFSEREETWVHLRKFSRASEESRVIFLRADKAGGKASNPNPSVLRHRRRTRNVHVSSLISLKTISVDFCLLNSQRFQPQAKAPPHIYCSEQTRLVVNEDGCVVFITPAGFQAQQKRNKGVKSGKEIWPGLIGLLRFTREIPLSGM